MWSIRWKKELFKLQKIKSFYENGWRDVENIEDIKQLVRANGSVGANYIEANESLGRSDLRMRIKISRKESKEAIHFLGLLQTFEVPELENEREFLVNEAIQLKKIFSKMLNNLGE